MDIEMQPMPLPFGIPAEAKFLMGFDYADAIYHVLAFNFGDDGGAIGIWREGDNFCARISLDSLAAFCDHARLSSPEDGHG